MTYKTNSPKVGTEQLHANERLQTVTAHVTPNRGPCPADFNPQVAGVSAPQARETISAEVVPPVSEPPPVAPATVRRGCNLNFASTGSTPRHGGEVAAGIPPPPPMSPVAVPTVPTVMSTVVAVSVPEGVVSNGRPTALSARLMHHLNESASWLSDVSDDVPSEASSIVQGSAEAEVQEKPRPVTAEERRCLAGTLNESATWIDCDVSDSDSEEEEEVASRRSPSPPAAQGPNVARVGDRQGVARSFSF